MAGLGNAMLGQDMLVFDLWSTDGARQAVFAADYTSRKETADGLWLVPDGYEIGATTMRASCLSRCPASRR